MNAIRYLQEFPISKISYFHIPEIEDRMRIDAYDLRDNKWNLMVLLRKYLF